MATFPTESDRFGSSAQDNTAVVAPPAVKQAQPESVLSEIRVIVHASHRSTAPGEAGKVQTIREETSTVLVFPGGAVVRLSSMLSRGDLVVLTNQQSRADMLCRAAYVREQTGGGSYVELEFTQRSAAFWTAGPASADPVMTGSALGISGTTATSVPTLAPILAFPGIARPPVSLTVPPVSPTSAVDEPPVLRADAAPPSDSSLVESPGVPMAPAVVPKVENDSEPITSAAREAFMRAEAAESPEFWLRSETETPAPVSARGGLVQKLKELSHSPLVWVFCGVLTIAAFLGESYLMGHRGASNGTAAATSRAIYPAQAAAARGSEAAPPSEPITLNSISVVSSTIPKDESKANAGATDSNNGQPRRNAIRMENLAAPTAYKPVTPTLSEPPPVLPAQSANDADYLIGAGSLTGAAAAGGPAPVAASVPSTNAPASAPSNFQVPKLISSTAPVYPPFARAQGVAGTVVLNATIDETGKVTDAKVISGSPLLRQAALDAVRQWKYRPAELNGQPVLSHATINVNFAR